MVLSRYQFELLSFVAENRPLKVNKRFMADRLLLSDSCVMRVYPTLLEYGWIKEKEGFVYVTDKGLEVLEQFRVKRAVILAAGFGSRMMPATADRPKPLVEVNGKRIIDTLLDALTGVGIRHITIVRGYHKKRFDDLLEKYPFLDFLDNDDYDRTNNISSAVLAGSHFKGGSYLCEADLYITNPAVIRKYQYASNILGSYSLETDDWSYTMDEDGHIREYKKGNRFCWNYYGISYWTPDDCDKLNRDWAEVYKGDKNVFWEQVPLQIKKDNYAVEIRPCQKQDIMEIDNYYELCMLDASYHVK
jgi:CTP:phosphocholine cytidylyltransferase-like protein